MTMTPPVQLELLRMEFPRYFNLTINGTAVKLRSFIVLGNVAAQTSLIELIVHRDSLPLFDSWLSKLPFMNAAGILASKTRLEVPFAGEMYLLTGVLPVSVSDETCVVVLSADSYH